MKHAILFFIILSSTISHSQPLVEEDWALHFPPVLDYEDYYIYKIAKNNNGNLFLISQKNFGGGIYKYVIIKIIMNNWIVEWVTDFEVVDYDAVSATDLTFDNEGNVYVSGLGRSAVNSNNDFIITKYSSSGEQLWAATYNGAINWDDWINDVYVDNSGNVYVTGASMEFSEFYWSATTIKYNTDGIIQWQNTYVDSNNSNEEGRALVADNSGNVYVISQIYTTSMQYLTIKYSSSGIEEWTRIDGTSENDFVDFIRLDNTGKITVGGTVINPTQGPLSYLIYKFNPDGSYVNGYNYDSYSIMRGMVVSPQGNVYVTGDPGSTGDPPYDIVTVKLNASLNLQWEKHFNYTERNYASDLIIDQNENILVTGTSIIPSVQTYAVTVKYNTNGDSLWTNIYTHQNFQNNSASRIVLDESGNSFVVINYYTGSSQGQEIIKLNGSGVYQWAYNYKSFCQPTSIKEDTQGNIYLTGFGGREQSMWDYITMKCDSSGNILWLKTYDGSANGAEQASDLEIDNLGNVYVTGGSNGIGTDYDFATIKYDPSGNEQWVVRYNGPAFGSDIASYMSVDQDGNVYVSGSSINSNSTFDIATIKYNNLGQLQWVKRYNGTEDGNDFSQGLEVDQSGNVFIAGTSDSIGSGFDYVTVKYNPSGNTGWVKRYNGSANDGDLVSSMSLDNSGDVYVTGWSFGNGTQSDYATVKYNNSGVEQWTARWDDPASSYDYANDIAVDEDENVYVTGISQGMGTDNDYTTVKYNSNGQQQWAVPYNGQTNSSDIANNIALDYLGDVYVTGHIDNNTQYSTVKYNQQGVLKWEINYDYLNYQDTPTDLLVDNSGNVLVTGYSSQVGQEWIWSIVKYKQPGFVPSDVVKEVSQPSEYVLFQNYPNPFNPSTTIKFYFSVYVFVNLKVFDVLGSEVATLVNEEHQAGNYEVDFNAAGLSSGIYFCKLQAGNFVEIKKMILMK